MATNSESAVCLQTVRPISLRETDSLLPRDQKAPTSIPPCRCRPGYWARRVRSKGAVLVIVWSLLTFACNTASMNIDVEVIFQSTAEIINGVVTAVLFLFAGWLADVYFGRYKVMKVSIWVM